jgi:hypothetical protein
MAQRIKVERVRFRSRKPVALELGVTLPPGTYPGKRKQIGLIAYDGMTWTRPEYKIELSGDQLAAMGRRGKDNLISMEYDITTQVRAGDLAVI